MVRKSKFLFRLSAAFLMLVMLFNISALALSSAADAIGRLSSRSGASGSGGSDQTIGGGDPSLGDIVLPEITENPYRPTVHELLYPVLRSDHIRYYDSLFADVGENGRSKEHSSAYTASLSALLSYYTSRRYARSVAEQQSNVGGIRKNYLNPDLYFSGQEIVFGVNTGDAPADDYTNFIDGSYVYDTLHLNKDHLTFVLRAEQVGPVHVKMRVSARLENGKSRGDSAEMTSNGQVEYLQVSLKDVTSLTGTLDGYTYNGAFTDVVAMLTDDTSPSVTDISLAQEIYQNDDAALILKMTFNEGIRFADLRERNAEKYLDKMWVEVEIEELETGEKQRLKLFTSEVGTDCTMTLRAEIGRYHYKQFRVNRITNVGFDECVSIRDFTLTAVDVTAPTSEGAQAGLYPMYEASGVAYSASYSGNITPITDLAGNSLQLDSIINWEFGEQFNVPSYGIEEIEIFNDKTLSVAEGNLDEDALLPEDLFIGTASDMTIKVYLSRVLTESQWKKVAMKLNISDKNGDPITVYPTRATEYSRNNVYDNGKIKGSVLWFENIRLTEGAIPAVTEGGDPLIRITEFINGIEEYTFYPYFDHPSTDMRYDLIAPTVSARLVSDQSGETDGKPYHTALIELSLADVQAYARNAGLVGGEIDVSLGVGTKDNIDFKYLFSLDPTPPAADGYTGAGRLAENGFTKVGHLDLLNDEEKLYLHLLFEQEGIYIEDLLLSVQATDAIGNCEDTREQPIRLSYLLDEVAPEVTILGKQTVAVENNTGIELHVDVRASDPRGIVGIDYCVGADPTAEDAVWTPAILDTSDGTDASATVLLTYGGLGSTDAVVNEVLYVRATDGEGNVSEPIATFISLSLEKPATDARLNSDGNAVSTAHSITVNGPAAATVGGADAYTRVLISPMSGNSFTYAVLVKTGESLELFDFANVEYYKVGIEPTLGSYRFTSVEGPYSYVSGEPLADSPLAPLLTYYGELKIRFENGYGSMEPAVGEMAYDAAAEGSYFNDPNYMTLRFASPYDEGRTVHGVDFGRVVLRDGTEIAAALPEGASPLLIRQSKQGFGAMRNMQIHFSIANIAQSGFGLLDLDYHNSYAEFYRLAEDGSADTPLMRVSGLSASGEQYFTVANTDDAGNLFETGAYYLKVGVRSGSGHEDVYTSGLIVLDAETADSAGVWEYSYHSPSNIETLSDPAAYGAVEFVRDPASEDYFTDFGISVRVGGESMRSRVFAVYSYGVSGLSVKLSAPNTEKEVAGVTVGALEGFKLWNILSAPSQAEIDGAPFALTSGTEMLSLYNRLDTIYDKDTIPKGVDGIGALHLVKGVNTFCYQAKLANGYVTPIRYFTVTVTDSAPVLNVAIDDYIPSHLPSSVSGVVNIDSLKVFIETAYSFNGSGKVDVQLWSRYAMRLGLYGADGSLAEEYYDTDENGEDVVGVLTVLKAGLSEGEYAILTENSYTSDFPEYSGLCTAVFVAVDEYGGTTVVAPQLGNAQRHRVYGGVANEKEYNISYDGEYYNDPYVLDDNGISWRVRYHEASYDGNRLLGFETYLLHNTADGEVKHKVISTDGEGLGRNLFHISSNDIEIHFFETVMTQGADLGGAKVEMQSIENAALITEESTITIFGDGIDGEVTLPLFAPNPTYGYLGARLGIYGYDRTPGLEFAFANPMATEAHPVGTERTLSYRLTLDNGYGESFSTPEYRIYGEGSEAESHPVFAGELKLYYVEYGVKEVEMIDESGAVLKPSFATAESLTPEIAVGKYNPNPADGSEGYYTLAVTDAFGNEVSLRYTIDISLVDDKHSLITVSNTEKTLKPVTVTIRQDGGNRVYADITDYDIMSVENNGTSEVTVTLTANTRFSYRYLTDGGDEAVYYISIQNIISPAPTVTYDRDAEDTATDPLTGESFLYGELNAYVVDPSLTVIDAASGLPARFTFIPGGPDTYVYPAGTLIARLGNGESAETVVLGEITVTRPYVLREIPDPIGEEAEDTVAPALQVLAYSNHGGLWAEEGLALQLSSRRGISGFTDYSEVDGYTSFAFSGVRANMEKLLAKMGWSTSYRFLFEIRDDSRVRLFVKEGIYAEAPDFESGISDVIEGVTLNSRLLTVTKAGSFTVFAVDARGNVSSVAFDVNNVGEAPAPTVRRVPIQGGVRVYLIAPEGATDLEILSVGLSKGTESAEGEFFGLPYVDITENDTYGILYKMKYNGSEIQPATISVSVSELRPDEITLTGGIVWSANKISEATASDVVARLLFSEDVARIDASAYDAARVVFTLSGRELEVTYKDNSEAITLRVYAENGSYVTVELGAVTNLDRSAPIITAEQRLAADARSVTLILRVNERATFKEGGGYVGTLVDGQYEYTRVITENGAYTYTFTDMSGLSASITVTVDTLVLEPLTALFSKDAGGADAVSDPRELTLTVGETVFVKPSRNATLTLSDGYESAASSAAFTPISIPASLGGISPYITLTDAYGNVFVGQFASIKPLDTAPPEIVINKDTWTVRAGADREALRAELIANAAAFDDSGEAVSVSVELPESLDTVGVYDVKYSATDTAGNTAELYGRLRITSIYDPIVHIGGVKVDRDEGVYLAEGEEILLAVNSAGIRFDLYLASGRKTAAQIKGESPLHEDRQSGTLSLGTPEAGIYTVLIVTEQRDYFRFIISVSSEEPGSGS